MSEIRLLFIAANQSDPNWNRLSLDEESRQIEQKIALAQARDRFVIKKLLSVRWNDLQQELQNFNPHIVHFSGHGGDEGQLYFLLEDGQPHPVRTRAIRLLFSTLKDDPAVDCALRLVVFNACYSEEQATAVVENIDFAIGMSREIGDDVAVAFSAAFYTSIAGKRPIKTAFNYGRAAVEAFDLDHLDEAEAFKLFSREGVDARTLVLVNQSAPAEQPAPLPSPSPVPLNDRDALVKTLNRLLPAQITYLITLLNVPVEFQAGFGAPLAMQVNALVGWAETPGGCGLVKVKAALDDLIHRPR